MPPIPATTTIFRTGGPVKSVSNHADRIQVLWHPDTSAAGTSNMKIERIVISDLPVESN